jgi:hypothetical protein
MDHPPPQATFTAPGLCHNLDVTGSPHAEAVTIRPDGAPQVPLDLGEVLGRHAVLIIADEDFLISLADAVLCAYSRLHMAHCDRPQPAPGEAA